MTVLKKYQKGNCQISVYDDSIKAPDEAKKIVKSISGIILKGASKQETEKKHGCANPHDTK